MHLDLRSRREIEDENRKKKTVQFHFHFSLFIHTHKDFIFISHNSNTNKNKNTTFTRTIDKLTNNSKLSTQKGKHFLRESIAWFLHFSAWFLDENVWNEHPARAEHSARSLLYRQHPAGFSTVHRSMYYISSRSWVDSFS